MKSKRLVLAALVSALPLWGVAEDAVPVAVSPATAPVAGAAVALAAAPEIESALTPKILYEFLLAEIAIGRGQMPIAAAAYADLARETRDPRIAKRAAEVAYYARQPGMSVEAARIWSETEPESVQAKQAYWTLLGNTGQGDKLAEELSRLIATEGADQRGAVLMQVGRMLTRFEDKKMVAGVASRITEPYLALPEAHFVRAQSAYSAGDNAQATSELARALAIKPDWEPAAILNAQLLIATQPEAAIAALAAFVKKNPGARDARLAYARALIEGKRFDDARAEFAALLKDEPERPDLIYSLGLLSMHSGDMVKAEAYLNSLLDKNFGEIDSVHYYLGQIAEETGRPQEAIGHYDAIAPGTQHHVQGQVRVVSLLSRSGQAQLARDRLRAAQVASPSERSNLLILEAQLLSDQKKVSEAYKLLADALKTTPDDTALLYEAALYAERVGKMDVLERHLRKVIKLKPDAAHAYNALGYSLADRNIKLEEANSLIDKALQMMPDDPAILDSKGWVSYRRGNLQEALEKLSKALAVRPDPEIAAHLGEVKWKLGRKDEASRIWDEALKLVPDNKVLNSTIQRLRR